MGYKITLSCAGGFSTSINVFVKSIANGMVNLLLITIVGSMTAVLQNISIPAYQEFLVSSGINNILTLGTRMTTDLISLYVVISIANEMAKLFKQNQLIAILLSIMVFLLPAL